MIGKSSLTVWRFHCCRRQKGSLGFVLTYFPVFRYQSLMRARRLRRKRVGFITNSRWAIILLLVALSALSACSKKQEQRPPADQSNKVVEFRQRPITDDPAVSGKLERGFKLTPLPQTPPEPTDLEREHLPASQFAPLVEEQLSAGATRKIELQVGGAAALLGSVRWDGTSSPLDVTLSLDGASVGTASTYSIGTHRGGSILIARPAAGGRVTLTVTNTSSVTVTVKMVLGALTR